LAGTVGEAYLEGRGIPVALANRARVRFAPDWFGRPAVLFPVRDQDGQLVGAQGRYVDGRNNPKVRSAGLVGQGVFATPGALGGEPLLITEAPLDALTLAAAGFPALALIGTAWPEWLPRHGAFRRVVLATDADAAGDRAAGRLAAVLLPLGARVARLRPWRGKDWNEIGAAGLGSLRAVLAAALPDQAREVE
jgi:DNA primase